MDENILRNEVKWEYAKNNLQLCSQRKTDELEEEALFNTEEKFIEAFKKRYNYDDIDEKYFNNKEMIDAINEYIEDCEGIELSEDEMAKVVYEKLYALEYGVTSDVDDLSEIRKDIDNRFPYGRTKM